LHILKPKTPIHFHPSALSWTPYLFGKETPLKLTQTPQGMALDLPKETDMPMDVIVVLTFQALGR
jgi:hypothetical protein